MGLFFLFSFFFLPCFFILDFFGFYVIRKKSWSKSIFPYVGLCVFWRDKSWEAWSILSEESVWTWFIGSKPRKFYAGGINIYGFAIYCICIFWNCADGIIIPGYIYGIYYNAWYSCSYMRLFKGRIGCCQEKAFIKCFDFTAWADDSSNIWQSTFEELVFFDEYLFFIFW